ncbi:MAG: succinylglutamate desuccinylase [Bdellovibrionales bacterium]
MGNISEHFDFFDHIPKEILTVAPDEIKKVFKKPSIIRIEGRKTQPLFLSLFLHGNETTGFYVLQKLTQHLITSKLNRTLIIFVGNVHAAEKNLRFLPEQKDFNRIWEDGDSKEHLLSKSVMSYLQKEDLFACVDIHNNTGANPLYSCISNLHPEHIYLGSLFSKTLVYFTNPSNALSCKFSSTTPSVTIECGKSGKQLGIEKAFQFVLDVQQLEDLNHTLPKGDVSIFHTIGQIKLLPKVEFGFAPDNKKLTFPESFEQLNFNSLPKGFFFAAYYNSEKKPFEVFDEENNKTFENYFKIEDNSIFTKKEFYASMFTKDLKVIKQDCLGYIMEKLP